MALCRLAWVWLLVGVPAAWAAGQKGSIFNCCWLLLIPIGILLPLRLYVAWRAQNPVKPEQPWLQSRSMLPVELEETAFIERARDAFVRFVRPDLAWPATSPPSIDTTSVPVVGKVPGTPSQVILVASRVDGVREEEGVLKVKVLFRYRYTHGQSGRAVPDWEDERVTEAEQVWIFSLGRWPGATWRLDQIAHASLYSTRYRWPMSSKGRAELTRHQRRSYVFTSIHRYFSGGPARLGEGCRVLGWPQEANDWGGRRLVPNPTLGPVELGRDVPTLPDNRLVANVEALIALMPDFSEPAIRDLAARRCGSFHSAWGRADLAALGEGMGPRLALLLSTWLLEDRRAGRLNRVEDVVVTDSEVAAVVFDGDEKSGSVAVTVRLWIRARDWTVAATGGEWGRPDVYLGDPEDVWEYSEYWTFTRPLARPEASWLLIDVQQARAYTSGLTA